MISHIWKPFDLVDSVLSERFVRALCGETRKFNRGDFPLEQGDEMCQECYRELSGKTRMHSALTWDETVALAWSSVQRKDQFEFKLKDRSFTFQRWA